MPKMVPLPLFVRVDRGLGSSLCPVPWCQLLFVPFWCNALHPCPPSSPLRLLRLLQRTELLPGDPPAPPAFSRSPRCPVSVPRRTSAASTAPSCPASTPNPHLLYLTLPPTLFSSFSFSSFCLCFIRRNLILNAFFCVTSFLIFNSLLFGQLALHILLHTPNYCLTKPRSTFLTKYCTSWIIIAPYLRP